MPSAEPDPTSGADESVSLPPVVVSAVKSLAHVVRTRAQSEAARDGLAALTEASRALDDKHRTLLAELQANRAQLRAAVHVYGALLRDEGLRPEHLVPAARALIPLVARQPDYFVPAVLESAVVTWTIEGYYRVPESTPPSEPGGP